MNGNPYPFRWTLPVGAFLIILVVAWWVWPRAKIWVRITRARIQQTPKTETTEKRQYHGLRASLIRSGVVVLISCLFMVLVSPLEPGLLKNVLTITVIALLFVSIFSRELKDIVRNRAMEGTSDL